MTLDRVTRTTAVDEVMRVMEQMILRGEVAAGERLPPERVLSKELGIARLTLRAALARLTARGLIAPMHGRGNVVLDVTRTATPAMLGYLGRTAIQHGELVPLAQDLLAVRRGLARVVLERLAPMTFAARELGGINVLVDEFHETARRPGVTSAMVAEVDHTVVGGLVTLSKLTVARLFLNPVFTALHEIPPLRDAIYADPIDNSERWRAVAGWLNTKHRAVEPLISSLAEHDEITVARLQPRPRRKK